MRRSLFPALVLLAACGTPTRIPTVWRNPDFGGGPFRNLFVIGVAESESNRRLFEDRFAAALSRGEASASVSYRRLPETDKLSEARIRAALGDGGHDAVVVTRLLGIAEESQYVPPETHVYRGYYGYYGHSWDIVHEPGYTITRTVVRLETNLYDVPSGELVWSGQSETFDPSSVADAIESVTEAVAAKLTAEGLIPAH